MPAPLPPRNLIIISSLVWGLILTGGADVRATDATISPDVTKFLKQHCVRCHGPTDQNASLRFDTLPTVITDEAKALQWQDILDVLNLDQMPPEDEPQPGDKELADLLETLTSDLLKAREVLADTGGRVVIRRLNRREYENSIGAAMGLEVNVGVLPEDEKVSGFDTLGQAHSFSSLHLERYLGLGESVFKRALDRRRRPVEASVKRHEVEKFTLEEVNKRLPKIRGEFKKAQEILAEVKSGKRRRAGDQSVRLKIRSEEKRITDAYLAKPHSETGAIIPSEGIIPSILAESFPRRARSGRYLIRVRCGADAEEPVNGLFLKVTRGDRSGAVVNSAEAYQVLGSVAEPQIIEFEVEADGIVDNYFRLSRLTPRHEVLKKYKGVKEAYFAFRGKDLNRLCGDTQPSIWIDWVEVEGPFPRFEPAIVEEDLRVHYRAASDESVRNVIERVAYELFRHEEPDPQYIDRVMAIYRSSRDRGAEVYPAMQDAMKVLLASPRFLFLYEPNNSGSPRQLTSRELAIRLSYFLWSSSPDVELYQAAESGELDTPEGLRRQVDRMLDSERSHFFYENFLTQFLELDRLDLVNPEGTLSDEYELAIQNASKREVFAFFRHLVAEDLPTWNAIDSDFVVVNGLMADFYGIPDVRGDDFRRVNLKPGSPRGGLLGQSAILTLTGTGDRTSPVERGAYVLRKLLDRPPPPAPANVPMLNEDELGDKPIRETLAVHMNTSQCMSCHRRIDPLGFALENFDPVGKWRKTVPSADGGADFQIETAGLMPDGKTEFANHTEMKRELLDHRDAHLRGLTEAVMTYGIGRSISFSDQDKVEAIVSKVADAGYGTRTLLHEIIQSESFHSK
ncbi:DUF1592 domain-containing protein [Stratiformator vulcanicus]|uniref:Planctomycete cytochrome C n=1 Tax=Stratiformator vulcanicus TaxID=2527980 RepID=A0A517R5B8_9PLAN|nr:DUF1592 domain-containing protein [Stratiformator vulcanicus]QDT39040.1 Planctomycete cytochrome C [Stratiformator vulcanicus]